VLSAALRHRLAGWVCDHRRQIGIDQVTGLEHLEMLKRLGDPRTSVFKASGRRQPNRLDFAIGQGYQNTNKVNNLSTVTQQVQTVTTQATNGSQPVGSVTITLTSQQLTLAQNHNLSRGDRLAVWWRLANGAA
jgi:hypothetical protein